MMKMLAIVVAAVLQRPTEDHHSGAAERLYHRAMRESHTLLEMLREPHPVQAVIAEIVARQDDMPFLVTVFEAVSEAGTPKASTGN